MHVTNANPDRSSAVGLRRRCAYFLAFVVCLINPSVAIVEKAGFTALIAYIVIAPMVCWWAMMHFRLWLRAHCARPSIDVVVAAVLFIGVLSLYLYVHPRIDTAGFRIGGASVGAGDSDDAIDVAITELTGGRYPYYAHTFLGNPLSPLPGALLLALPFYVIGDSALQNVFWTAIFFWFVQRRLHSLRAMGMLAALVVCLSPNVAYQIAQGTDYGANAIYVLIFTALLISQVRRDGRASAAAVLCAALLGIGLSSRLNFLVILPFVFFTLRCAASWRTAAFLCATALITFVGITAPFYVYDPAGFSPLHTFDKLSVRGSLRWMTFVALLIACVLCGMLVMRRRGVYTLAALARDMAVIMAFLVLISLVTQSLARGEVFLNAMHFGTLSLFFGVFGFGPQLLDVQEEN